MESIYEERIRGKVCIGSGPSGSGVRLHCVLVRERGYSLTRGG